MNWRTSQRSDLLIIRLGIAGGGTGQQSFDWQVQTYNSQLSVSSVYFLWVRSATVANFTSHYFSITDQAQSSSSSNSSTTSPSSASSTTSVMAISTSSTPPQRSSCTTSTSSTPTSHTTASPSTENVKVGLGVGVGVGIPLVLIAGIWIGLGVVKQRRSPSIGTSSEVPLSQVPDNKYPSNSYPTDQLVDWHRAVQSILVAACHPVLLSRRNCECSDTDSGEPVFVLYRALREYFRGRDERFARSAAESSTRSYKPRQAFAPEGGFL